MLAGLFSVAVLVSNHWLLTNNYPGVHFFLALVGLTGLMAASKPWRRIKPSTARWERWCRTAVPLVCLPAFISAPSQSLRSEQLKVHGSVVAPHLTQLADWLGSIASLDKSAEGNWIKRSTRQPVASSQAGLLPEKPLVLLITIDAVRADVLEDPNHATRFKTLGELRRQSVYFKNARAPGSQTVTSLSGVFSGLYFSQQYWTRHSEVGHLFLGDDEPARFPEVLQQAGIKTVTFSATYFLLNRFGIVRGFDEERFLDNPGQPLGAYSPGSQLTDALLNAIERDGHGSLFLYAHYLDTHFPYKAGGRHGTGLERYLRSIAYVDRQIRRLVRRLQQKGFLKRTLLVIASDHGEAFGEHNSKFHATTLYEEQLRVPLMVRIPGLQPRVVADPVSLMDLGPTLLDLLGQTTPAHFMGQSLVPLLRGRTMKFSRPLLAEGRLKKALYYADGYKLIVDDRNHTLELYDLKSDPQELANLIDHPDSHGAERLEELREFFRDYQIRRPGYQIPYRP
jgi:arylsulfatase A-like enzyme